MAGNLIRSHFLENNFLHARYKHARDFNKINKQALEVSAVFALI